jgi:hypothetical protein
MRSISKKIRSDANYLAAITGSKLLHSVGVEKLNFFPQAFYQPAEFDHLRESARTHPATFFPALYSE